MLSILYSTVMVNVCFRISLLKTPPVCVLTLFPQKSPKGDLETFNNFYHFCIFKGEDSDSSRVCLRWTELPWPPTQPSLTMTQDSVLASVWTNEALPPLLGTCTDLLISQLEMSASSLGFSYFSNGLMLHRCSFSPTEPPGSRVQGYECPASLPSEWRLERAFNHFYVH